MQLERSILTTRPEVVDDFVRNFLVRMGMQKTLNTFQCEWYELQQKGAIRDDYSTDVPDVYTQNGNLETEVCTYFTYYNKCLI